MYYEVHVVKIVNVVLFSSEKHVQYMKFFGLAEDTEFPALGFIPGDKSIDGEDMVGGTDTSHSYRVQYLAVSWILG